MFWRTLFVILVTFDSIDTVINIFGYVDSQNAVEERSNVCIEASGSTGSYGGCSRGSCDSVADQGCELWVGTYNEPWAGPPGNTCEECQCCLNESESGKAEGVWFGWSVVFGLNMFILGSKLITAIGISFWASNHVEHLHVIFGIRDSVFVLLVAALSQKVWRPFTRLLAADAACRSTVFGAMLTFLLQNVGGFIMALITLSFVGFRLSQLLVILSSIASIGRLVFHIHQTRKATRQSWNKAIKEPTPSLEAVVTEPPPAYSDTATPSAVQSTQEPKKKKTKSCKSTFAVILFFVFLALEIYDFTSDFLAISEYQALIKESSDYCHKYDREGQVEPCDESPTVCMGQGGDNFHLTCDTASSVGVRSSVPGCTTGSDMIEGDSDSFCECCINEEDGEAAVLIYYGWIVVLVLIIGKEAAKFIIAFMICCDGDSERARKRCDHVRDSPAVLLILVFNNKVWKKLFQTIKDDSSALTVTGVALNLLLEDIPSFVMCIVTSQMLFGQFTLFQVLSLIGSALTLLKKLYHIRKQNLIKKEGG